MTLFPYEAIERAIIDSFRENAWLCNTFDISDGDDYECCEEAMLMRFYRYD